MRRFAVLWILAALFAWGGSAHAFDLRELKEIVPAAKLDKLKKDGRARADALWKQKKPLVDKRAAELKQKLAKKYGRKKS